MTTPQQQIKNKRTGTTGFVVKKCFKTIKVCIAHPRIKNAHAFVYWREADIQLSV